MEQSKIEIYNQWKVEQEKKAREFYRDPFTDEIPDWNKISYVHTFSIGGTVDSQILGVNRYQTRNDAYDNMINFKEHENKFVFARGKFLEPFVAKQFSEVARLRVHEGNTLSGKPFGCNWSFAQVDFYAIKDGVDIPLEIKVSTVNYKDEDGEKVWGKGSEFNAKGDLLIEDSTIPTEYYIQCQKQLWLSAHEYMYLCVWLTFETKVRIFVIHRNESVITKIIEGEKDFLFNHVIPQIPYEEEPIKVLENEMEENSNAVYADDDFLELFEYYQKIDEQYKALKKEVDTVVKRIKELMGNYDLIVDAQGQKLCGVTHIKSKAFDLDSFKNEYPELYKKFITFKESTRFTSSKRK